MITLDAFIAEVGTAMGIGDLALDAEGQARLSIEGRVVDVLGDRRDGRLLLSCLVGEIQAGAREVVMAKLLAANTMLLGTRGATLGVPAGSDAVVLARAYDFARESGPSFAAALVAFAELADDLAPLLVPDPDGQAAPDDRDMVMFRI